MVRFLFLILCATGIRIALILTSQRDLNIDESIIGLMAKHIMEGKEYPIFPWGAWYNGGSILKAYIASLLFYSVGISDVILKIVPLFTSIIGIVMIYFTLKKFINQKVAELTILLLGLSPNFATWNLRVNGYNEIIIIEMLSFSLLFHIIKQNTLTFKDTFYLGLASATGLYFHPLFIPVIIVSLIILFAVENLRSYKFLLYTLLVSIPLCLNIYTFTTNPANFSYLMAFVKTGFSHKTLESIAGYIIKPFQCFYSINLPVFKITYLYVGLCVFIFILSTIFLCYREKESIINLLKRTFNLQKNNPLGITPLSLLLIYIAIYYVIFFPNIQEIHFMPIYPVIMVIFSATAFELLKRRVLALNILVFIIFSFMSLYGLFYNMHLFFRKSSVLEPMVDSSLNLVYTETSAIDIQRIISYMEQNMIMYAYAPVALQYRIIFESKEKIMVSCTLFGKKFCIELYPPYLMNFRNPKRFAVITYKGSYHESSFRIKLGKMIKEEKGFGNLHVFIIE